jgi:uncharacterized damage-inducible protein DinB
MSDLKSILDEALEAWHDVREGVIAEIENIPADKMDFRPTKEVRTVREQEQHILEVAMMATGEFTRPDTNLLRAPWPKLLELYAKPAWEAKSKDELLALLRSQIKDADRKFREQGELALFQFHKRFDGKPGSKLAWVWHAQANEWYHRGQLATYARMMGLVPALTQQIQGS